MFVEKWIQIITSPKGVEWFLKAVSLVPVFFNSKSNFENDESRIKIKSEVENAIYKFLDSLSDIDIAKLDILFKDNWISLELKEYSFLVILNERSEAEWSEGSILFVKEGGSNNWLGFIHWIMTGSFASLWKTRQKTMASVNYKFFVIS